MEEYGEVIHLQDEDPRKRTKTNIEDIEDYKKIKDLNRELSEKIDSQTVSNIELTNQNKTLFLENKNLKEENALLKTENAELKEENSYLAEKVEKINKIIKDFGEWIKKTDIGAMILDELNNEKYQKVKNHIKDVFR